MSRTPIVMCWSGGKDSALALGALLRSQEFTPVALLTTLTEGYDRISMHGVRHALLKVQAEAIGLPLYEVWIPNACVNDTYQHRMRMACEHFKAQGVVHMGFGDLFLEDIRAYRDAMLAQAGMQAVYPLWRKDTAQLARDFITQDFRATLCCTDPAKLDARFCGREFDETLLEELPPTCDPCGENGEFHTFVHQAPYFRHPIACRTGERVQREGFDFCDIMPGARVYGKTA